MIWQDGMLLSPGRGPVYGERMYHGYRVWDPFRSKFSALCHLGFSLDIGPSTRVLYLGAAHGTTVSHLADYAEVIYAVERAPRPVQDLLAVAERRENIIPILADASRPHRYSALIEPVDLLYQDIAHPDQVAIAAANMRFLAPGGSMVLVLKTRSIDVCRDPAVVASSARESAVALGIRVDREYWLQPYHRDHVVLAGGRAEDNCRLG